MARWETTAVTKTRDNIDLVMGSGKNLIDLESVLEGKAIGHDICFTPTWLPFKLDQHKSPKHSPSSHGTTPQLLLWSSDFSWDNWLYHSIVGWQHPTHSAWHLRTQGWRSLCWLAPLSTLCHFSHQGRAGTNPERAQVASFCIQNRICPPTRPCFAVV